MATETSDVEPRRTVRSAVRDGFASGVDAGLAEGVANGLRRYLPLGMAIIIVGVPFCGLCAFFHFVLGLPLTVTAIAALAGAVGVGGAAALLLKLGNLADPSSEPPATESAQQSQLPGSQA